MSEFAQPPPFDLTPGGIIKAERHLKNIPDDVPDDQVMALAKQMDHQKNCRWLGVSEDTDPQVVEEMSWQRAEALVKESHGLPADVSDSDYGLVSSFNWLIRGDLLKDICQDDRDHFATRYALGLSVSATPGQVVDFLKHLRCALGVEASADYEEMKPALQLAMNDLGVCIDALPQEMITALFRYFEEIALPAGDDPAAMLQMLADARQTLCTRVSLVKLIDAISTWRDMLALETSASLSDIVQALARLRALSKDKQL